MNERRWSVDDDEGKTDIEEEERINNQPTRVLSQ